MPVVTDPSQLMPTELVLFHGDSFAQKALIGNVGLPFGEIKVSVSELGRSILAAAFVASADAGALRLELRSKKGFLGLGSVQSLYAVPVPGAASPWPQGTVEAALCAQAANLAQGKKGPGEVSAVVYNLYAEDMINPWSLVVDWVKRGLAARGLLLAEEQKKLKIFTVTRYSVPASTAELVARQPLEPVQQLLATCQEQAPQLWKLLLGHINRAIRLRTESTQNEPSD